MGFFSGEVGSQCWQVFSITFMHDAIVYSSMLLFAVDGCIRLCQQLQAQQQLVSS